MEITARIHRVDGVRGAHAYLILEPDLTLVDTGIPGQAGKVFHYLERLGLEPQKLRRIILTHHDLDHMGSAAAIKRASGVQLWAHQADVDYVEGRRLGRPLFKGLMALLGGRFSGDWPKVDRALTEEELPGGIQVIWTPGHTPGSLCLLLDGVLISGDLIWVGKRLRPPPPWFTQSSAQARASIAKVAQLSFHLMLSGHGPPLADAQARVAQLAATFDR